MLKLQPRLPYNLIGHNYEIIANMCKRKLDRELPGTRFLRRPRLDDLRPRIRFCGRSRAGLPCPRCVTPLAVGSVALTMATIGTYNYQIKNLLDEIMHDRLALE